MNKFLHKVYNTVDHSPMLLKLSEHQWCKTMQKTRGMQHVCYYYATKHQALLPQM